MIKKKASMGLDAFEHAIAALFGAAFWIFVFMIVAIVQAITNYPWFTSFIVTFIFILASWIVGIIMMKADNIL